MANGVKLAGCEKDELVLKLFLQVHHGWVRWANVEAALGTRRPCGGVIELVPAPGALQSFRS